MKCPYCGYLDSKVVDSRLTDDDSVVRRRRGCEKGGERFTTYERLDNIKLQVIKRDASRQEFDRAKLANSIIRASGKRKITTDQIEAIVDEIENIFLNSMRKEVASAEIGEMVMEKLKTLDEVAYVRFASVYRQFKDIDSFMKELTLLLKKS